ncbi:helicase associated domain-containing protein [Streptomyces sp. NPDC085466]|uniref:helicase associated domain-containing protein n=1 Tax=Streptomyces sp. NPDC085466 TaxID=3365725 RepID=UPI0037D27015
MAPQLPPGVPPQPCGTRIAYQHRETRVGYRIQWYQGRLTLQDALETIRERDEPELGDGEPVVGGEDQEEREHKLGAWIGNQRSRAATLTPERMELLSAIAMRWS